MIGLIADSPWTTEIRKSVDSTLKNNNRLNRLINENKSYEKLKMSDGTARDAVIYHHPQEHNPEFLGAIERIVKGLYYKDYTKVLIEHYEISVFQPDAIHHTLQKEIIERISETQIYSVNSNTIQYMFFNCQVSDVVCAIKLFNSF